jgi:predicted Rossmann fold nucleotide-binding protein DprA/Smf involved in DNA uptake
LDENVTPRTERITQTSPNYPEQLREYLKTEAPEIIWARGNTALFDRQDTRWALFCSSRCPGEIILKTHELAQQFQKSGIPTIGGYHSPVEGECLRVLLRGAQPIILCPARGIENMRLKPEWKRGVSENRLLILSIFDSKYRRSTATLASQRNAFVAALADKVLIAHAAEGSQTLEFAQIVSEWNKPLFTFETETNKPLLQLGARPIENLIPETH